MKKIVITGGAGFIGQKLAKALLTKNIISFNELLLVDIITPSSPINDQRVKCLKVDLTDTKNIRDIIDEECSIVFHLAAIVSSHAESDFDLGMQVNFDVTRNLLEACRTASNQIRFIFTSSLAVFGGKLPAIIQDDTAVTPQSSYGAQKAMGELLVNDYIRKGFVDGCVVRLPTICVRPGKPNKAASSFVSSIIREPLQGDLAICPVSQDLNIWISSPATVVNNLLHATQLSSADFTYSRTINLPGISVSVRQMLDTLKIVGGEEAYANVIFKEDEAINKIVSSWPGDFYIQTALAMGFKADSDFTSIVQQFIENDLQK